jgi:hypothetical protein
MSYQYKTKSWLLITDYRLLSFIKTQTRLALPDDAPAFEGTEGFGKPVLAVKQRSAETFDNISPRELST